MIRPVQQRERERDLKTSCRAVDTTPQSSQLSMALMVFLRSYSQ
jgi:hypothetical protein